MSTQIKCFSSFVSLNVMSVAPVCR